MSTLREAAQQALEALEATLCDPEGRACIRGSDGDLRVIDGALEELRSALEEPEPQAAPSSAPTASSEGEG